MQSDSMRWKNLSQYKKTCSSLPVETWTQLFLFFFLLLYPHRQCGAAWKSEILGATSGAEMADVKRTQKMTPFITCEISLGQYVCELMFGVNVTDWILGSKFILSNNQSKAINSVGPWNMSHCGANYGFIVLEDIQQSTGTRMRLVCLIGMRLCMFGLTTADGFPCGSLLGPSVLFGMKYFNHQIPESESWNTVHA